MTTRLPLVAAQPGIWMAERLSTLPGAWSVAHYVELRGALDPTLLGKAIVAGLQQADTLSLRFEEEEGEVWQWVAADRTFGEPSIIDLRTAPDPHRAATERMQADLAQDLRVDGGNPLVRHVAGKVAVQRGPLVYCLEGRDHGGSLSGLRYCRDALYQPVPGDGVLAGEVLLTGPGARRPATDRLYSSHAGETQACNLRAIPYFAWNNRGADEMDVWLPLQ